MIVVDASVLIAHLDADDVHHDRAEALLGVTGDEPLGASRLTLAEVLVGPARAGKLGVAMTALAQLGVNGVGLDTDAPGRLAGIRAETRLKMPDCCVLLVAEQLGGRVASFDDPLVAAGRAMGLAVLEV
ncbi:MAG TPA: type II toxin-antitoxin system VapC family toxin [Acidimicrobiales bacterium]|nr:type II toxin-antitoxin system VapC family toxin [Acidimicrobiales bacterium]